MNDYITEYTYTIIGAVGCLLLAGILLALGRGLRRVRALHADGLNKMEDGIERLERCVDNLCEEVRELKFEMQTLNREKVETLNRDVFNLAKSGAEIQQQMAEALENTKQYMEYLRNIKAVLEGEYYYVSKFADWPKGVQETLREAAGQVKKGIEQGVGKLETACNRIEGSIDEVTERFVADRRLEELKTELLKAIQSLERKISEPIEF
ncbi:MAG: hypothetical protein NZM04_04075 [Methylacidiphilales bacterium]|nr:hypothetical protein [Candidatus Methylacidiphilales bacterium]MDW8350224.1 hypothetical protein [Verrucomicrobiae bacterium]